MSNTLTNTALQIYSNKVIDAIMRPLAPLFAFSLDLSPAPAQKGADIRVPLITADTAGDFDSATNNYSRTKADLKDKIVHVTKRKVSGFGIDNVQALGYPSQWWERKARADANSVAAAIMDDLQALITPDNFGNKDTDKIAIPLAGFKQQSIAAIRAAAVRKGLSTDVSTLVLNSDFFSALLSTLDAHTYGGPEAIRTGRIPFLYGFSQIIEWPNLNIPGFVAHPDAIAVANRYLPPVDPRAYEEVGTVTDDESGLTLGIIRFTDRPSGLMSTSVEGLYGMDVGQENGMLRIV